MIKKKKKVVAITVTTFSIYFRSFDLLFSKNVLIFMHQRHRKFYLLAFSLNIT